MSPARTPPFEGGASHGIARPTIPWANTRRRFALPRASAQTQAEVEQLMGRLREANERLIVTAMHAQELSEEAHIEATQAKRELDDLMRQLREANERLAAPQCTHTRWR
jgi:lysophospholipase L1-like esterase